MQRFLFNGTMVPMSVHYKKFIFRLEKELAELEALAASGEDSASVVELDQTKVGRLSRMDAMQGQAMAKEALKRRESRVIAIKQALKRYEDGDYGFCVMCEEQIPNKRLNFDPAISTCLECMS